MLPLIGSPILTLSERKENFVRCSRRNSRRRSLEDG